MTTSTRKKPSVIKGRIIVICSLLALCSSAYSQVYNFYFPKQNAELPQQFIYALNRDKDSYLWVGTGEGLVKFDGNRIISTYLNKNINTSFCTAILSTDTGVVAGFYDGSIAYGKDRRLIPISNTADGRILTLSAHSKEILALSSQQILAIDQGRLKVKFILRPEDGAFSSMLSLAGNLYLGTSNGLFLWNEEKQSLDKILSSRVDILRSDGRSIFIAGSGGIQKIQAKTLYTIWKPSGEVQISDMQVENTRLYAAFDSKLLVVDQNKTNASPLIHTLPDSSVAIKCISVQNGEIWLGTYGLGMAYYNSRSFSFRLHAARTTATPLFVGFSQNHLIELDKKSLVSYPLDRNSLPEMGSKKSIPTPFEVSCAQLGQGRIWLGSVLGQIAYFDLSRSTFHSFGIKNLPSKKILSISAAKNGIYVAVQYHGVFLVSENGEIINQFNTENGLLHNDIQKIFVDSKSKVWFLSRGSGLTVLDENRMNYLSLRDGLSSLDFTDVAEDKRGNIWLSTEGGGLNKIGPSGIESYGKESGLSSDYIVAIAAKGDTVICTSRGAIDILLGERLRKIESSELCFTPNFQTQVLASGGSCIVAGSEYGPLIQNLDQLWPTNSVRIKISSILVDDKNNIEGENISLSYGDYKIQFNIEKINLNPFYTPDFEYKLEGFDKEWQELNRFAIIYQSIKDDEYTFVVRDKSVPENVVSMSLNVDKPFWKKPAFYLLALLIIAGLTWLIFRIRIKQLEQSNRELEAKVNERTAELRKKNEELEQFTFAISHDLKNPAINMVELVKLMEQVPLEQADMHKTMVTQLGNVSKKMLHNLMDLIELLKFAGSEDLPKEDVDLASLIQGVREGIAPDKLEGLAELDLNLHNCQSLYANKANLHSIFQNLISNSIKYRKPDVPARIKISAHHHGNIKEIRVEDNGLGIDMEKHGARLFGIFQRLHHHVEGSGIGLHLVKSMVEKNGGQISVESELGKGTTFILRFEDKPI